MTITDALSAPLVAVVGACGTQGGSVIKALEESDRPYRVRAFTRVATKPAAQALASRGVEVVTVSLVVENAAQVYKVFEGANMAFLVTNFWEHMNAEKETAEGKLLIDAAKAGGADRIVWSGLVSFNKHSTGKFQHVYHFESKAAVADYARQVGAPFVDVQAGFYASNLRDNPMVLSKLDDGSVALEWPMTPTTLIPIIDIASDYGLFVRQVFELPVFPSGSEVFTAAELIPAGEIARQLAEVTGKKVLFRQATAEEFGAKVNTLGLPAHISKDLVECFAAFDECGYYGSNAVSSHEGLGRKPKTWKEYVRASDWSKVF